MTGVKEDFVPDGTFRPGADEKQAPGGEMGRYCLEVRSNGSIIHRLSCPALDLGTLLGTGCLVDLGEFPQLALALDTITPEHPGAQPCRECCARPDAPLPQAWKSAGLPAVVTRST